MCGIVGILGVNSEFLEKASSAIKHRGPDDSGVFLDSKSKIGPNLWNLINRPKASANDFTYSKALSDYGGKWTFEELNGFIYKPKEYISGKKMNFAGLNNVEDRADLILWLRQYSDNPVPLP